MPEKKKRLPAEASTAAMPRIGTDKAGGIVLEMGPEPPEQGFEPYTS
jgi:hypothetical protein